MQVHKLPSEIMFTVRVEYEALNAFADLLEAFLNIFWTD